MTNITKSLCQRAIDNLIDGDGNDTNVDVNNDIWLTRDADWNFQIVTRSGLVFDVPAQSRWVTAFGQVADSSRSLADRVFDTAVQAERRAA